MTDAEDTPPPPDDVDETLIQRIDALPLPELKSLRSYIEQRIESLRTPLEAEIEANAAGEVLEVEDHGSYALVRMHPPKPDGSGFRSDITSLYHVQTEPHPDGTESLHWAYLGDGRETADTRCAACGRTFDLAVDVCPHCGSADVDHTETEK